MADKQDIQIGQELRRITGAGYIELLSGVVTAVDAENMECTVQLTKNAGDTSVTGTETDGVLLNVKTGNTDGLFWLPVVNADCLVAEIDGPGKWEILKASAISSYTVVANGAKMVMQGGKFQLKNGTGSFKDYMDSFLGHLMALTVPTGTGPSGVPNNNSDFESDQTNFDSLFF